LWNSLSLLYKSLLGWPEVNQEISGLLVNRQRFAATPPEYKSELLRLQATGSTVGMIRWKI